MLHLPMVRREFMSDSPFDVTVFDTTRPSNISRAQVVALAGLEAGPVNRKALSAQIGGHFGDDAAVLTSPFRALIAQPAAAVRALGKGDKQNLRTGIYQRCSTQPKMLTHQT